MSEREPGSEHGRRLRARVSDSRWARIVAEADTRATIVEAVVACRVTDGLGWRKAVAKAVAGTCWPTFVNYKRHYESRTGETWERLLDGRVPPARSTAAQVRVATCTLRQVNPDIGVEAAREVLCKQVGEEGEVSDAWLRRVWAEAGLARPVGGRAQRAVGETVEPFHGGAGLALIAAAEAEVGSTSKLADTVATQASLLKLLGSASSDTDHESDVEGRDDDGRFTAAYNKRRRAGTQSGQADERWSTDAAKAEARDLSLLSVVSTGKPTLVAKMLAMGVTPLLTERRGFDGLDGPAGAWLGVLGGVAYMPTTLDKALAEFALMSTDEAMWQAHAATWSKVSARWRQVEVNWLRVVLYVDGTADPYWTRAFAKSGKVSKLGTVMPCLSRVAVHSGEGVPLLVATFAGAAPLKRHLLPLLARLAKAIGPAADTRRLTVVDSEAGKAGLMWAMHDQTDTLFVVVIKGQVLKGATLFDPGEWQPYRERDQVRDVEVHIKGKDAPTEGIIVRGVQMRRADGRRQQTTLFGSNAAVEDFTAVQVADMYLDRWPKQEQKFRNGRNGGGLNRSHGFGGRYVTHAALEDKQERAQRSLAKAQDDHERAAATLTELDQALADAPKTARHKALGLADRDVRDKGKRSKRKEAAKARLDTTPTSIFERDVGRDSIMTCLKLNVLTLLEFVLQEYFGGLKMEWRTFIEHFAALPVTVRTTRHKVVFQIHANLRQRSRMAQLEAAVAEINRRRIRRGKQLLVFELDLPPPAGS